MCAAEEIGTSAFPGRPPAVDRPGALPWGRTLFSDRSGKVKVRAASKTIRAQPQSSAGAQASRLVSGETDQVEAGEWAVHLLHGPAAPQTAEVDGEEAGVFEERNHLGLGVDVVT